jgi:hypothetical protein
VNTPGLGGYAVAWALSVLGVATVVVGSAEGSLDPRGLVMVAWVVAWLSTPFAVGGIAAVDIACRDVRAQWVHVAAAGLAGAVTGCLITIFPFFGYYPLIGSSPRSRHSPGCSSYRSSGSAASIRLALPRAVNLSCPVPPGAEPPSRAEPARIAEPSCRGESAAA